MGAKTVRVTGYIRPDAHRRLRVLAAERGVRVTVLLREAVDAYLTKESTDSGRSN